MGSESAVKGLNVFYFYESLYIYGHVLCSFLTGKYSIFEVP